jgi:hypothetical protein
MSFERLQNQQFVVLPGVTLTRFQVFKWRSSKSASSLAAESLEPSHSAGSTSADCQAAQRKSFF